MDGKTQPWQQETAAQRIAAAFAGRLSSAPDERLAEALRTGVGGLLRLIADLRLTGEELRAVIRFLTETGHHVDARRQEWVLLADLLGVSTLVEELNHPRPPGATPNTVAGPFYRPGAPEMPAGGNICRDGRGEPMAVAGFVGDLDGHPVAAAMVEVWHANAGGRYENQDPDRQPDFNLRGRFRTDARGRFRFHSIRPGGYRLPSDGPAGRLMAALGQSPERPAHIHFRVTAPGYATLTTHIFDRADPAIGRDAIFGVKPELLAEFRALPPQAGQPRHALDLNFVLCPEGAGATETPGRTQP